MADLTTFNQPVAAKPIAHSRAARPERSRARLAGNFTLWAGLLAGAIMSLGPIAQFSLHEVETATLTRADDATVVAALEQDWPHSTSADRLETLSELSLRLPTPDMGSAYAAAQRTTQIDPSRAFAWANLAWLEMKRSSGAVSPATIDALTKSMDACPLCDEGLIRWRFNFVLANWQAMPEAVRRRVFEQADLLRWNGPNAEFLADMRAKARSAGVPFDAYRSAVNTPVRTWDLGATQAQAASKAASGI
ncbi:MAG: hypothetical protein QM773_11705 [Hyphomonadaceae bacterium]